MRQMTAEQCRDAFLEAINGTEFDYTAGVPYQLEPVCGVYLPNTEFVGELFFRTSSVYPNYSGSYVLLSMQSPIFSWMKGIEEIAVWVRFGPADVHEMRGSLRAFVWEHYRKLQARTPRRTYDISKEAGEGPSWFFGYRPR